MEKPVKITSSDGKSIYGVLNGRSKKRLIIFVHGLGGHPNEHIFHNAAKYFPKQGFSTFRFGLYGSEPGARQFVKATTRDHAADVKAVIKHFRKLYKQIFLVGHSMGGPSILLTRTNDAKAVVLWDPTQRTAERDPDIRLDKKQQSHVIHWHVPILMGMRMFKDWQTVPDSVVMLQRFSSPTLVILAEASGCLDDWKGKYKPIHVIKNATHCFDEEGAEEKLFSKTLSFFKQQAK